MHFVGRSLRRVGDWIEGNFNLIVLFANVVAAPAATVGLAYGFTNGFTNVPF